MIQHAKYPDKVGTGTITDGTVALGNFTMTLDADNLFTTGDDVFTENGQQWTVTDSTQEMVTLTRNVVQQNTAENSRRVRQRITTGVEGNEMDELQERDVEDDEMAD